MRDIGLFSLLDPQLLGVSASPFTCYSYNIGLCPDPHVAISDSNPERRIYYTSFDRRCVSVEKGKCPAAINHIDRVTAS